MVWLDFLRADDQPAAAFGQIVEHLGTLGRHDLIVIEKHDVSGKSRGEAATVLYPEKLGRLGGGALDCALEVIDVHIYE
jgi:hypothetical protein